MLLAYVDESYNETNFYLSALVLDDAQGQQLIDSLDSIVNAAVGEGVPSDAELHGAEIFHGSNHWKGLPPWLRIRIYQQATDAIGDVHVASFFSGVDLVELSRTQDSDVPPHELALRFLLESLQSYAEQKNERILAIADEIHTAERHRTRLKAYRNSGTLEGSHLDRIFDTLYFGPSRHSRLLQAADLLTYIYLRRSTIIEHSVRAGMANRRIWKPIEPTVVVETVYPGR